MNIKSGQQSESVIYEGQFGEFTVTAGDRRGVQIYRAGLVAAAISFAVGTGLVLWQGSDPSVLTALTGLYACFSIALGISLWTIHIYLLPLHRTLQAFWAIGTAAAVGVATLNPEPLAWTVYHQPLTILGIGFTFAALTGIFFKEAFCFNRLETKLLTPLVPLLLLGHLVGILPTGVEQILLGVWAIAFGIFALRKAIQPIPPDIGDKSVFEYLKQQKAQTAAS